MTEHQVRQYLAERGMSDWTITEANGFFWATLERGGVKISADVFDHKGEPYINSVGVS